MASLEKLSNIINSRKTELLRLQNIRLWLGLGTFILLVASQIAKGFYLEFLAVFVTFPLFWFFLKKSRKLLNFIEKLTLLQNFYKQQRDFRSGVFHKNKQVEEMFDVNLARDLDLGFLFANINFCLSKEGELRLNKWLCQELSDSTLSDRQSHIKELTQYPGLLRRLHMGLNDNKIDFAKVEKEIIRSFFPDSMQWKWLVPASWLTMLLLILLSAPAILWKLTLLIYVASVLAFINRTQHLFSRLQDLHQDLSQLGSKMQSLEKLAQNLSFTPELKKAQVSQDINSLSRLISLMSIKTNPILFYVLNMIFPWDFFLAEFSERSRKNFFQHFQKWSVEVVEIEALASLANLAIYQNTQWAEVKDNATRFVSVKELSHPLLNQETVVKNNFDPEQNQVIIITGSNMSGKSTFLRALGTNLCLANIGAPVFAQSLQFKPMQMVTCIRVSDSLRDGQSYFYAEVLRMKHILQQAKQRPVFFLIDEPLRGTNNRERLIGNQSYLEQILQHGARGLISTHDLELTKLADGDDRIANFHFSDRWQDQELHFDYKIKSGPSETTNALKILSREGLYTQNL